ncbi:hypothetical protein ACDH53_24550 [Pseudomonas tremae]|uniref:Uncharacterized protein n=1 Tax=Pseudomonas tremae TaxID=200454 RepID=A0ABV4PLB3_9PSED|nr:MULTISPECIES: hypothetical protein [Pseudomonas syringae group]RMS43863.1 hypothetical protein ALP71_03646 [Pseudomonas coronafaciens pv. garcae]
MKKVLSVGAIVVLAMAIYTQFTFFVVAPIRAVPEGSTVVMFRLNKTEFIDSADAICVRIQGNVNLLCRGAVLAGVLNGAHILARLPYSESLYLISTGNQRYDR